MEAKESSSIQAHELHARGQLQPLRFRRLLIANEKGFEDLPRGGCFALQVFQLGADIFGRDLLVFELVEALHQLPLTLYRNFGLVL